MRNNTQRAVFLILVLLVTITFFGMIKDFLLTSFWAAVLAVIFYNVFRRINIRLRGRRSMAAAITTVIIFLTVLLPLLGIFLALVNETLSLYEMVRAGDISAESVFKFVEDRLPALEKYLGPIGIDMEDIRSRIGGLAMSASQLVANQAIKYTSNAISFIVQFFLTLYLLFFFLRDGRNIARWIVSVLPLGNRTERVLMNRFASVSRATLKGTLIVAFVQGAIGGLLFWAVGIHSPIFWGVIMMILSLLPVGGSGFVWIPAAIFLFIEGEVGRGIAVVITGALIIGLVDNLLRPLLVGRDTQMPDYLVLLATLGGLVWLGLSGFVVGPIIAALFVTCWEILGKEFGGNEL